MKRNILILILLAFVVLPVRHASAQRLGSNDLFYHSFRSPLATRLNPAAFPASSNWYVTLPRVGAGVTTPVSYNDLGLRYDASRDTTTLNLNDLLSTLDSCGTRFDIDADVDLIGFGFKVGRLSFNAASGIRVVGSTALPLGATRLVTEGNAASAEPIEMGSEHFLQVQAYGYASLGAAYSFPGKPLTLGARLNLLDGIATASADHLSLSLATTDGGQSLKLSSDYLLHTAGIAYLKKTEEGGYELGLDSISLSSLPAANWGCTFDLGATYQIGAFNLSASLLDVGPGIHWTHHPAQIVPEHRDSEFSFDGIDLSSLLTNGSVDSACLASLADSLTAMVRCTAEEADYWAGIPTRLYLGASYSLNSLLRVGYLLHGEWDRGLFAKGGTFRCSNTLSATASLFDWFDLTVANALSFDGTRADAFNPGIAASFNIGKVVQLYVALDYISNLYATDLKSARVFLGLNLVQFHR